ncbi:MAG: ABC transporter substrate-binding protein, partial [Chloroflexota bacterium]
MGVERIVSLVPSVTESLFDLGAGHKVVGRTVYCAHPAPQVNVIPAVGGTKNPDIAHILALKPDLVIANQEENRPADVAALQAAGVRVLVSFPRTVRQALDLLWELARWA